MLGSRRILTIITWHVNASQQHISSSCTPTIKLFSTSTGYHLGEQPTPKNKRTDEVFIVLYRHHISRWFVALYTSCIIDNRCLFIILTEPLVLVVDFHKIFVCREHMQSFMCQQGWRCTSTSEITQICLNRYTTSLYFGLTMMEQQ
jgi:hypothetical protein